jgi:hypothetical protein
VNRQQAITEAREAARRARILATETEQKARSTHYHQEVGPLAAAGALWADTARAYTALAQTLPEDTQDATEDTGA